MMYEGCTIYRFAGFPIYAADNRPFKTKRTREDALFLPSYINCTSYILPSYIYFTSYIVPSYIFLALFSSYSRAKNILFVKKNYTIRKFFRTRVAYMKNIL